MKKFIITCILIFTFNIFTINIISVNDNIIPKINITTNKAYAQVCVLCKTSTTECVRIIIGDKILIYHGNDSDCPDPEKE
jgi:hypothetical protein